MDTQKFENYFRLLQKKWDKQDEMTQEIYEDLRKANSILALFKTHKKPKSNKKRKPNK